MSTDADRDTPPTLSLADDPAAVRAALLELVRLKDWKTQHGETEHYRARRDQAWAEARRVLGPAATLRKQSD